MTPNKTFCPSPFTWLSRRVRMSFPLLAAMAYCPSGFASKVKQEKPVVRTAVIGGMIMTGLWDRISQMFEAETGHRVEVVAAGQRPALAKALRQGKVDLLTMHSGDITTNLVADGYGVRMRPWAKNDLVICGPHADPAGIRGLHDGTEALRRIATAKAKFIDSRSVGPREVCHMLWRQAGITPRGDWYLKDKSESHLDILSYAAKRNAYVVVGRMPILFGKIRAPGMEILVDNDPAMRRPYIVMEANPSTFPTVNSRGARALSDFLLSREVQEFLGKAEVNQRGGVPLFHPVSSAGWVNEK